MNGAKLTLDQRLRIYAALYETVELHIDRETALFLLRLIEREKRVIALMDSHDAVQVAIANMRASGARYERQRHQAYLASLIGCVCWTLLLGNLG